MPWVRSSAIACQIASENLVGQFIGLDPVERSTFDGVVREHERVRLCRHQRPKARCSDTEVAGGEGQERFVLDGSAQRREGPLVAEVVALDPTVDPEQQVGAALVLAEHLDEELVPALGGGEVRRRAASVDAGGMDLGQWKADAGHAGGDGVGGRPSGGCAEGDERGGTGEPADHDCLQRIERGRRRQCAHDHQPDHGDPSDTPPRPVQPGCSCSQGGCEDADAGGAREPPGREARQVGVGRDDHGAGFDSRQVADECEQERGDRAGDDHRERCPPTITDRRPQQPSDQDGDREHPGADDDRGEDPVRDGFESDQQLGDEGDDGVAEQPLDE